MNNWPNNHWSECRRATSVGNADPLGRTRRSVHRWADAASKILCRVGLVVIFATSKQKRVSANQRSNLRRQALMLHVQID